MPTTNLRDLLLRYRKQIETQYGVDWLDEYPLSMKNANKFFLAAIINYKQDRNIVWKNARIFAETLLKDPPKLWNRIVDTYSKEEWAAKRSEFKLHHLSTGHERVRRIALAIVNGYDGDVRKIWQAADQYLIRVRLNGMRCGPVITEKIMGWLNDYGHISESGEIAPDSHVKTVLQRLLDKNLTDRTAKDEALKINPNKPWELDLPLYVIGIQYCKKNWCYCEDCPMNSVCLNYEAYKRQVPTK